MIAGARGEGREDPFRVLGVILGLIQSCPPRVRWYEDPCQGTFMYKVGIQSNRRKIPFRVICDLTELETRNKVQLSVGNRGLVILTINLYPVLGEYRADGASNDATQCTSNMSIILYILRDIT